MAELRDVTELSPGVHRVEKVRNDKLHGYHVLEAPSGPVLVDPGFRTAPEEVYEPFLNDRGWELSDVSMGLITHPDADHHGGNSLLREHNPSVTLVAHKFGADLIEDNDRIMDELYGKFEEEHAIEFSQDIKDWLIEMLGPAENVDVRFTGGEEIKVKDRELRVIHTPGHRKGHIMLYDPDYNVLLAGDGILGRGVKDVKGNFIEPPPYWLHPEYANACRLVSALNVDKLSCTHYDLIQGRDEIDDFVSQSLSFVNDLETIALDLVDELDAVTLKDGIEAATDRIGDLGLNTDYAYCFFAHYEDQVEQGNLVVTEKNGLKAWKKA